MKSAVILALTLAVVAPGAGICGPNEDFVAALKGNNVAAAKDALGHGADPRANIEGKPAIHWVIFTRSAELLKVALDRGADPNAHLDVDGVWTLPIDSAAMLGTVDEVTVLLDRGISMESRDSLGDTPLMLASAHPGSEEAVRLLLRRGANVNAATPSGTTALHVAASLGSSTGVSALLAAGGKADARDNTGRTPYQMAMESTGRSPEGKAAILRLLSGQSGASAQTQENNSFKTVRCSVRSTSATMYETTPLASGDLYVDLAPDPQNSQKFWFRLHPFAFRSVAGRISQCVGGSGCSGTTDGRVYSLGNFRQDDLSVFITIDRETGQYAASARKVTGKVETQFVISESGDCEAVSTEPKF